TASGPRGLNVGETLTVRYTQTIAAADVPSLTNTASVTDRFIGDSNDSSTVTFRVATGPEADDDSDLGNTIGDVVTVDVLGNDTVTGTPATVRLLDGSSLVTQLVVAGEGVWTVVGADVVFTPEAGFLGDPTPVSYRVTDADGLFDTATVTVTYLPEAVDDQDLGNVIGTVVTVDVLGNDMGDWDVSSARLVDPATNNPVTTLVVTGEGTWTVNTTTGAVSFAPASGFAGSPAPVDYEVTDNMGDTVTATVTITYAPAAV